MIVQQNPAIKAGQIDVHVDALAGVVIAALTLTQVVVSGQRIRRPIGDQEGAALQTDKPWRERPCDFARGEPRARRAGSLTPWFVRCRDQDRIRGRQTAPPVSRAAGRRIVSHRKQLSRALRSPTISNR